MTLQCFCFTSTLLDKLRGMKRTKVGDDGMKDFRLNLPCIGTYSARLFSERSLDGLRLVAEVRASGGTIVSITLCDMRDNSIARLEDAIKQSTLREVYIFGCICDVNFEDDIDISLEHINSLYKQQSAKDALARDR